MSLKGGSPRRAKARGGCQRVKAGKVPGCGKRIAGRGAVSVGVGAAGRGCLVRSWGLCSADGGLGQGGRLRVCLCFGHHGLCWRFWRRLGGSGNASRFPARVKADQPDRHHPCPRGRGPPGGCEAPAPRRAGAGRWLWANGPMWKRCRMTSAMASVISPFAKLQQNGQATRLCRRPSRQGMPAARALAPSRPEMREAIGRDAVFLAEAFREMAR